MQNITRLSDDIVRNLARILDLRGDSADSADSADHEMKETTSSEHQDVTPVVGPSAGLVKAKRPSIRRGRSRLVCRDCRSIVTPKWRAGPHGPGTLCNVCGLLYAKRMGITDGLHDG